jgi:hypothetical protein
VAHNPGEVLIVYNLALGSSDPIGTPGAKYRSPFREYWKSIGAKDELGRKKLYDDGDLKFLIAGTRVKVLQVVDAYTYENVDVPPCYEVRVLNGQYRGEALLVHVLSLRTPLSKLGEGIHADPEDLEAYAKALLESDQLVWRELMQAAAEIGVDLSKLPKGSRVAKLKQSRLLMERLVAIESKYDRTPYQISFILDDGVDYGWPTGIDVEAMKAKAKPKPRSSASLASQKFKLGQVLEKTNPAGAIGYYEEAIKLVPGTATAKKAEARVKVLKGK